MPDRMPSWRRYVRFWGSNVTADVDEEIAFHIESLAAELVARGMSPDEARRAASERFGNQTDIARTMRALARQGETRMQRTEWRDALARDLRFAVRQLGKRRGFAAVALLSIALGIGANTAIFSAVNAVLLHPVATRDVSRIMLVRTNLPAMRLMSYETAPGEALDIMARRDVFDAAGAWAALTGPVLTDMGEPRRLAAAFTLGRFFDVFGVVPALGRLYRPDESERDQHRVAVLSYALWQELGGSRAVVGKHLTLNGQTFEVVGVAPREFDYPRGTQIYLPQPVTPATAQNRRQLIWNPVGRMRAGITRAQFDAGIRNEQKRWHDNPAWSYGQINQFLSVVPLATMIAGQLRPVLLVLLGAVGFVLLIACANVASLQLVHGTARAKELAVRAALGAERGAIVRQLLVENLLLSLAGGVLGVGLGRLMLSTLGRMGAAEMPALEGVKLSPIVLAFAAAATIGSGLLFGLAPAIRGARVDLNTTLKDSTRGASMGGDKHRLLQTAVVAQVALTMMLLLGSGLLIRSLRHLLDQRPGFNPEHVVTVRTTTAGPKYKEPVARTQFYSELLGRLRASPGVSSAALVSELPFSNTDNSSPFRITGRAPDPNGPEMHANMRVVSDDYFTAMRIPVLEGRAFDATDVKGGGSLAAIIDAQLAKQFFPNEDPIGKQINQGPDATIVGVVGTVSHAELGEVPKATIYYSFRQADWYSSFFITLRTPLPAPVVASAVRAAAASVDRNAPVYELRTLDERIDVSLAPRRLAMTVLTALAAVSLLLAIFGLYGVISYAVSQRTTEFGIRAALGAQPRQVRALVVRQGLTLALVGMGVGLAIAWVAMRSLSALLFGVSSHDPLTFGGAVVLVSVVAAAASFVPARRATAIPLTEALRAN